MKNYTYLQLTKLTGKSVHTLRNTCHKLDIPRFLIKGITHISQDSLETLESYFAPKTLKINDRVKIRVMERYFKTANYRDVAKMCRISRVTVKTIIEEWEQTGCVVVDSSINFPEKSQHKGIFKRGKLFGYQIMNKGVVYYKSGFTNELSAVEELLKLKESLI